MTLKEGTKSQTMSFIGLGYLHCILFFILLCVCALLWHGNAVQLIVLLTVLMYFTMEMRLLRMLT